jgi:hypothetical protein
MHFDTDRAEWELGYRPRPLAETLADAHAFWADYRVSARAA